MAIFCSVQHPRHLPTKALHLFSFYLGGVGLQKGGGRPLWVFVMKDRNWGNVVGQGGGGESKREYCFCN